MIVEEASIYAYLAYRVLEGDMGITEFTLYLGSVRTFFGVLQGVFGILTSLRDQSREINDYHMFLEYPEREVLEAEETAGSPVAKDGKYVFTFENVSFQYPETERYALKNMNLTLEAGERLAVVGMNGAGTVLPVIKYEMNNRQLRTQNSKKRNVLQLSEMNKIIRRK